MKQKYAGSEERTVNSVVRVHYMSMERGELVRFLEPGDEIELTTDRCEVVALEETEGGDEA